MYIMAFYLLFYCLHILTKPVGPVGHIGQASCVIKSDIKSPPIYSMKHYC